MEKCISLTAQRGIQEKVEKLYKLLNFDINTKKYSNFVILDKEGHSNFCEGNLFKLPRGVSSLSSGQPWLMYWLLHALNILDFEFSEELKSQVIVFIAECKSKITGAFAGGPYQLSHLAPTYASLCTLISINSPSGYEIIDRKGIYNFMLSMKRKDLLGAFKMHENGESDMRSAYCAICVASVLNILDDAISEHVGEYIVSCQNCDGGFAAEPFGESHGGYTYCAIASLIMLDKWRMADCERALEWCLSRQMDVEGGFNGRPNKLVDSCYSFWIGASINILQTVLDIPSHYELFDKKALQAYVLIACQSPMGFFDKPGSAPDFYHTAYSLAGLSLAQSPALFKETGLELAEIDPLINVLKNNAKDARNYFKNLPPL